MLGEALGLAAKAIDGAFRDQPLIETDLRDTIGLAYHRLAKYPEAERHLRAALDLSERSLGPDHPATLTRVNNLAALLKAKADYAVAEPLYQRALAGSEKALGPDHPDTLLGVHNLAALLRAKGDLAAAEPLFRQDLVRKEKALGPDHPSTLVSVNNLAGLYSDLRRYADATPLFERAMRGYTAGPELARAVPFIRSDFGLSLLGAGKPAAAELHLLAGYDGLTKQKTLTAQNRTRLRKEMCGLVEIYESTNQPVKEAEWRARLAALPPEVAPRPRPTK
jgi:tetratricopeptide (TPR) repeat protein